jgi:hypothetical protein
MHKEWARMKLHDGFCRGFVDGITAPGWFKHPGGQCKQTQRKDRTFWAGVCLGKFFFWMADETIHLEST